MTHHDQQSQLKTIIDFLTKKFEDFKIEEEEVPPIPEPEPARPVEGFVKQGGWLADLLNRDSWKIVNMKDRPQLYKVTDDKGKNVATDFSNVANATAFIEYFKIKKDEIPTKITDEIKPVPVPPVEEPPGPTGEYPIPTGFKTVGEVSTNFKHWGRHETNYASGGSGPSERWDNASLPSALNVLAGYEVNLGERKGVRGDDNFDLKFRGSSHSDTNGGWYIPSIEWGGKGQIGKEYPHPKTSHLKIQEIGTENIGPMKGDFWVGFLACCYNDKDGVPTIMLWGKPKGKDNSNKFEDYIFMGQSRDTGNMQPGPVLTKIGMIGSTKQILQIRMDEAPDAKIRNAFAVEIEPPTA